MLLKSLDNWIDRRLARKARRPKSKGFIETLSDMQDEEGKKRITNVTAYHDTQMRYQGQYQGMHTWRADTTTHYETTQSHTPGYWGLTFLLAAIIIAPFVAVYKLISSDFWTEYIGLDAFLIPFLGVISFYALRNVIIPQLKSDGNKSIGVYISIFISMIVCMFFCLCAVATISSAIDQGKTDYEETGVAKLFAIRIGIRLVIGFLLLVVTRMPNIRKYRLFRI